MASDFDVEEIGIVLPYSYCDNDPTRLSRMGASARVWDGWLSVDRFSVLGGVAAYSGGGGTTGVTSIRPVVPTVWASEAIDLL